MYVIGTAGHVDHGKTALIEALTGINADRLPEEKKRGMTIDLGFAHFTGPNGEEIGVIDVPGHERFIRNMTAGAWSLDMGLLVTAVDDGWMEQTEDHARVLFGMGVRLIILVLTKCDLADQDQIDLVREDAEENIVRIFGTVPVYAEVSAHTGEGIAELRKTIISLLPKDRELSGGPGITLYIDRVFTMAGAGTVITGSLKTGVISTGAELTVLPSGAGTRVRSIQSYYREVDTAYPVSRVAVNLQGVKREDISRGMCITDDPSWFWTDTEFLVWFSVFTLPGESGMDLRRQMEVEISFGTFNTLARFYRLKDSRCARIVLRVPAPLQYSQPVIITSQGGSTPLAWGRALWPGAVPSGVRDRIAAAADRYTEGTLPGYPEFQFLIFGYARAEFHAKDAVRIGEWIIQPSLEKKSASVIRDAAARSGGTTLQELSGKYPELRDLEDSLIRALVGRLITAGELIERKGILFPAAREKTELSKTEQRILETAAEKEPAALEPKDVPVPGAQKEIRNLVREGLLVQLEDGLYYRPDTYKELCGRILDGLTPESRFSIPDAKDRAELSRKFIIPLLNRMEADGFVRREENLRIVL